MNHVTVGVYNSNDYKVNIVKPDHLENHIEYNKFWRFGRALFVDGNCVYEGYLSKEQIDSWTEKIANMKFDTRVPSEKYW